MLVAQDLAQASKLYGQRRAVPMPAAIISPMPRDPFVPRATFPSLENRF